MIVCIEPHYDDAILSAGSFLLENRQSDIHIVSVFTGKNKDRETEALCKQFKWKHSELNIPDLDYFEFKRKYKSFTLMNFYNFINDKSDETGELNFSELQKQLNLLATEADIVLLPLGVGHPAHFAVSLCDISTAKEVAYYRDFPHSYKTHSNPMMTALTKGLLPKFKHAFTVKFNPEKFKLFQKHYKSQRGLLWFEKKFFERKPLEEYYRREAFR